MAVSIKKEKSRDLAWFLAAGLSCRAIPVPRSLGVTCDYALEIQNIVENDVYAILELLKKNNLQYTKLFHSHISADGEVY